MPEFVKNISNFWWEDLAEHKYAREVPFVAKNFDHLDRAYYNKDYLLQSFNEELPNAAQFKGALDAVQASVSWTCILPDVILPTHKDTFYTLRQEHNVELDDCYRYLIFLEDWVFGHYVGFEDTSITHWKAGDVWKFTGHEMHYGVNASNVSFHTCQVSTFK
jgi:hypothetical protein